MCSIKLGHFIQGRNFIQNNESHQNSSQTFLIFRWLVHFSMLSTVKSIIKLTQWGILSKIYVLLFYTYIKTGLSSFWIQEGSTTCDNLLTVKDKGQSYSSNGHSWCSTHLGFYVCLKIYFNNIYIKNLS